MALYQRRGSNIWTFRCKVNGKSWDRSTGTADKRKATEIALRLEKLAQLHREQPSEFLRLSQAIVREVARVETDISSERSKRVSYALQTFLKFAGDLPLEQINERLLERFQRTRLTEAAKTTVNEELCCMMRLLRKNGFIVQKPEAKAGKVTEQRPFTPDDLKAFFLACPERLRLYYLLLLHSGARPAELIPSSRSKHVPLLKSEINFLEGTVTIRSAKVRGTRKGKVRIIRLPDDLLGKLKVHLKDRRDDFVFDPMPNGPRDFDDVIKAAGIPKFDPLGRKVTAHSFRHTFGTFMAAEYGQNQFAVKDAMGHEKLCSTERYCHVTTEVMVPIIKKMVGQSLVGTT